MSDTKLSPVGVLALGAICIALAQCGGGGSSGSNPPAPGPTLFLTPSPSPTPTPLPTTASDAGGAYQLVTATDNPYGSTQQCVDDPNDGTFTPPGGCYLLVQSGSAITSYDQPNGNNGGLEIQYSPSGATIAFGVKLQGINPVPGSLWTLNASPPVNGDIQNPLSGMMDAIVTPNNGVPEACSFMVTGMYDDETGVNNTTAATYQVYYTSPSCHGGPESGSFSLQQESCSPAGFDVDRSRRRLRPNHVVRTC